jgi:hypothetical protein
MQSQNGQSPFDASPYKLRGSYTGERMHPALRRQLLTYISQGKSDNQIAKVCKVSRDTLRAFRQREAETISQRKQTILATFTRIAAAGSEAIESELAEGKIKGALLVPVVGMSVDKILALSNDPQQINITHTLEPGPNLYEKLNELARAINSRPKPIQAEVIEASAAQPSLPNGEAISDSGR